MKTEETEELCVDSNCAASRDRLGGTASGPSIATVTEGVGPAGRAPGGGRGRGLDVEGGLLGDPEVPDVRLGDAPHALHAELLLVPAGGVDEPQAMGAPFG